MRLQIELSGGAELLFGNQKSHVVDVVDVTNLKQLLVWIKDNLLQERPELFLKDDSVICEMISQNV
jgi:ubiquitin related modifier 1